MFSYRQFVVPVLRNLEPGELACTDEFAENADDLLAWNSEYADLCGLTWSDSERVFSLESDLIRRIEESTHFDTESEPIDDELFHSPENLYGLDLGVASTVVCPSALSCIPLTSCNAGIYGGTHQEDYPLVACFANHPSVEKLLAAAGESSLGLKTGPDGSLVLYADDIRAFTIFAERLISAHRRTKDE